VLVWDPKRKSRLRRKHSPRMPGRAGYQKVDWIAESANARSLWDMEMCSHLQAKRNCDRG